MGNYIKITIAMLLSATLIGCAGGYKSTTVDEIPEVDSEASGAFIFVESEILDIDSDLMADRFGSSQRAGQDVTFDSVTIMKTIYQILVDSILGQDAAHYDLEKEQPNLYQQYLQLRTDKVMRLMYQGVIIDSAEVSDSAVNALYEEQKETFFLPEQYRARHIVIAGESLKMGDDSLYFKDMDDEKLDSVAHAEIVTLHERLVKGDNFDTLAMLYSHDENSAARGGDLGYFDLTQMVNPFDSAVEHTEVGIISGIFKTEYGWHVIKVEDHAMERYLPVDSVYQQLMNTLIERDVAARSKVFMDNLKEQSVLVFDTAALQMADSLHDDYDVLAVINPDDKEFGNDPLYFRDYKQHLYSFRKYKKIEEGELPFDDKIELLTGISAKPLLNQMARKLGYDSDPDVEQWAEMTIKKYSVSSLKKILMEIDYEPTEEELRAYYDSHMDDYLVERPLTVQHIVFEDSSLAEHVRDLLMSGVDFMEMVDLYYPGDPEIKRAAADLGDIGPNDMPSEFYAMAKRTATGSISRPVKTHFGYHLIKVLKKTQSIEFDRAKVNIKSILKKAYLENKLRNFVDSRLTKPLVIHWDRSGDLYYEDRQIPDFSRFQSTP